MTSLSLSEMNVMSLPRVMRISPIIVCCGVDCSGDNTMASGANMFSPYAVKYPHANTGVLPFLFPGYGGLLPPGFAAPHLPITGTYSDKEPATVSTGA